MEKSKNISIVVSRAESNVNEPLQNRFFSFTVLQFGSREAKSYSRVDRREQLCSVGTPFILGALNWDAAELAFPYVLPLLNNLDLPSAFAER